MPTFFLAKRDVFPAVKLQPLAERTIGKTMGKTATGGIHLVGELPVSFVSFEAKVLLSFDNPGAGVQGIQGIQGQDLGAGKI